MNFNLFNILFSGMRRFIFPAAIALNMFSTTAFLIVLSLLGKYEVAADVGIIQGATLAVFMAFSANARNLVLGDKSGQILKQIFEYRLLLLFPLSLIAYVLSKNVIETVSFLALLLILRRCSEWIAELHISERELQNDIIYANNFIFIQLAVFFILVTSAGNEQNPFYQFALLLWAVSPILQIVPFIRKIISQKNVQEKFKLRSFLPHVGSSWIIAISTYVFRVIIVLLAGKAIGGILFSAYAIGGMLNSIYTYALGPSIAMRLADHNVKKEIKFTWMSVSFLVISGLLIVLFSLYAFTDIHETEFFIQAIGYSLIGGGIMILAQRKRIHILQLQKESVFVQDVLSNILIIATLPFAFYLLGQDILAVLFLWNAFLAFVFYNLHNLGEIILKITNTSHFVHNVIKRTPIQTFILLLLFFPLFFQLNGTIFNSYDLVFDSKGSLFLLPLPIAVIACFAGIPLLIRYKYVELSAGFIFSFFVLMVFSTLIVSIGDRGNSLAKFIFLVQFVLPAFALLLGQSYVKPGNPLLRYESIILFILCIIIPAELIASLGQDRQGILTPYLYGFSLYQHLQYLPVIFVGLYFLSVASVYKYKFMRILLLCLAPFVIVYAFASFSRLAIIILLAGIVIIFFMVARNGYKRHVSIFVSMFIVTLIVFLFSLKSNEYFIWRLEQINIEGPLKDIKERLIYYYIYLEGITENLNQFLFGSEERPDRLTAPSAHNYYLDLVYNFGFISLLPFLYLILYTIKKLYWYIRHNTLSFDLLALAVLVLFFLLVDNSLKVGLRQPYPGIIVFFLWGVLLSRLMQMSNKK